MFTLSELPSISLYLYNLKMRCSIILWRLNIQHNDIQHNDIQHNDIQHNDIQHNDIQHNDIQHNNKLNTTLSIMVECCYAKCQLC